MLDRALPRAASPPSSSRKALLLLGLLPTRPLEFCDRVRTIMDGLADRGSAPAQRSGGTPDELLHAIAGPLGADPKPFVQEPAAARIEAAVRARQQELAPIASFGTFHHGDFALARLCYAICRALRPKIVVETGVAFGVTTAFILQAMSENGTGALHSVDLPPLGRGADEQVGFLVPAELRSRWKLYRGSSRRVLPGVLRQVPAVDLFIHDSLHTYRHMQWEFSSVWPKIPAGGALVCDDVDRNRAFEEFSLSNPTAAAFSAREEKKQGSSYGVMVKVAQ